LPALPPLVIIGRTGKASRRRDRLGSNVRPRILTVRSAQAAGSPMPESFDHEGFAQHQLDAYNARDLERFVAEYTDDAVVFRLPGAEPISKGKPASGANSLAAPTAPACFARQASQSHATELVMQKS
jgi:hypothetical protein